jgi:hypothetical protein
MTRTTILCAALLTTLFIDARTEADAKQGARWCMKDAGAQTTICSYATREQCMASRTGQGDWCIPSPHRRRR